MLKVTVLIVIVLLKGRSLVSQIKFSPDDVILIESPLVSSQFSWNKAYGYAVCEHCMFPLESAEENIRRLTGDSTIILPYPEAEPEIHQSIVQCQDCSAKFCGQECLTSAEKYHKLMCLKSLPNRPFDKINELWK